MSTLQQFLLYNLLPALVAGTVTWAAIWAGIELLRIRQGKLRLCLLAAPLIKSTLVLLGIGLVLPWPREVFATWQASALPTMTVLPIFVILAGVTMVGRSWLVARSKRLALQDSYPAEDSAPRLVGAFDRALGSFERNRNQIVERFECTPSPDPPRLHVTRRPLHSPLIVTEGDPVIVFPEELVDRLDDAELEGALAHEMAHLELRNPSCFSSETVRSFVAVNPMVGIMASYLHREEEKACDDMAVAATGKPETYAGMLLTSYRFASESRMPLLGKLQYVPQLLGVKPMLSERIERLLEDSVPSAHQPLQFVAFCLLWAGVIVVFFSW